MPESRITSASTLLLRPITADDAAIVARLHTASWRTAYRGILSDEFLDGEVELERNYVWMRRLANLDTSGFGAIASFGTIPVGFVFVVGNTDPHHGCLIDNLHVAPEARSAGIGPQLMAAAARGIESRRWDRRVHLFVFDANVRARAFYRRMGGVEVEQAEKTNADGTTALQWRVAWPDIGALLTAGA